MEEGRQWSLRALVFWPLVSVQRFAIVSHVFPSAVFFNRFSEELVMASLLYMVLNIYCYRKVTSLPKLCQCLIYIYIYCIAMEIIGIDWRGFVGLGLQSLFIVGAMLWSGIAYYWPDWHQMQVNKYTSGWIFKNQFFSISFSSFHHLIYLQFAIFLLWTPVIIFSVIIPESARWLLAVGREEKGKAVRSIM